MSNLSTQNRLLKILEEIDSTLDTREERINFGGAAVEVIQHEIDFKAQNNEETVAFLRGKWEQPTRQVTAVAKEKRRKTI